MVRSSSDHYNEPFLFFSSPKVADFINLAYNQTGADMALKLEAYCISGVSGMFLTSLLVSMINHPLDFRLCEEPSRGNGIDEEGHRRSNH